VSSANEACVVNVRHVFQHSHVHVNQSSRCCFKCRNVVTSTDQKISIYDTETITLEYAEQQAPTTGVPLPANAIRKANRREMTDLRASFAAVFFSLAWIVMENSVCTHLRNVR